MCDIGIRSEERYEVGSKVRVFVCQLESKGREDEVETAAVLEIARTKEGRSKAVFRKHTPSHGLSDRGFPCPGKPVQPKDGRLVEVLGPRLDLGEYSTPRPFETTAATSVTVLGFFSTTTTVQH